MLFSGNFFSLLNQLKGNEMMVLLDTIHTLLYILHGQID
jgi:hypothetical protein